MQGAADTQTTVISFSRCPFGSFVFPSQTLPGLSSHKYKFKMSKMYTFKENQ